MLDREIERLPAVFRDAMILCHLEGRAHDHAARELGCPLGTLHSRLARAKARLRAQLLRRGVALPAVAAGTLSARLVHATVTAATAVMDESIPAAAAPAVALSKGVLQSMFLTKTKYVVVTMAAVVALGAGAVLLDRPAATAAPAPAEPTLDDLKRENERLRREVASLKAQLAAVRAIVVQRDDDPPPAAEGVERVAQNYPAAKPRIATASPSRRKSSSITPTRRASTPWSAKPNCGTATGNAPSTSRKPSRVNTPTRSGRRGRASRSCTSTAIRWCR